MNILKYISATQLRILFGLLLLITEQAFASAQPLSILNHDQQVMAAIAGQANRYELLLKNNSQEPIKFTTAPHQGRIHVIHKLSTCHGQLSADSVCSLVISYDASLNLGAKRTSLTATTINNQTIKLPLVFDVTTSKHKNISLENKGRFNWQLSNGPYGGSTSMVLTSPNDANILYASTSFPGAGIYQSTDGGKHWLLHSEGLPLDLDIMQIMRFNNALYILTYAHGIFKSTDDGVHWLAINNGLPAYKGNYRYMSQLLVHNHILYAVMSDNGIYFSTDQGEHWQTLTNKPFSTAKQAVLFDGNTIYLGTYEHGVEKSTDAGKNWQTVDNGLGAKNITSLIKYNGAIYAGSPNYGSTDNTVFKTVDGGTTWAAAHQGLGQTDITGLTSHNNILFATTTSGIYKTTDDGNNWTSVNVGLLHKFVNSISFGNGNMYAATEGSIYKKSGTNDAWHAINTGINNLTITALAVAHDGTIYAGSYNGGVYKSTDNGHNWHEVKAFAKIDDIAIANNRIVYIVSDFDGVYKSSDGGQSWTKLPRVISSYGQYDNVFSLLINGKKLYAGSGGSGVYYLDASGSSWQALAADATIIQDPMFIYSMSILGHTIYAGTMGSVWKANLGSNGKWIKAGNQLPPYVEQVLAINDGTKNGILYAATSKGFFVTKDGGVHWQPLTNGLPNSPAVTSILTQDDLLMIGSNKGIYFSNDNGNSWQAMNQGLQDYNVKRLIKTNGLILAGTERGLYQSRLN